METLPVDVIPNIAQYLQVKDLASCCAVSPWWRDVFGSDEVWKPWCDVDSEEYLRTTPCQVEPKFTIPRADNSTLSPIGRWRTAYMREAHMWSNWISGNCVQDKITFQYSDKDLRFLNNDLVVLADSDVFELLDTSVNPSVCKTKLDNPLSLEVIEVKVVRNDMFIAIYDESFVQGIGVDLQSHTLSVKYTFCVSEDEQTDYVTVGSVFVGMSSNNYLHIWNLENGSKLKTESCILPDGYFMNLHGGEENCDDIIVMVQGESDDNHCFVYNLKELKFLPFKIQISTYGALAIVKSYVALSSDSTVMVYNYENSKLLHDVPVNRGLHSGVQVQRGNFIFKVNKNDLVQLSPATGSIRHMHSATYYFLCVSEKLVVVKNDVDEYVLCKFGPTSIVKTSVVLGSSFMVVSQAHSKVVMSGKGGIVCIHLW